MAISAKEQNLKNQFKHIHHINYGDRIIIDDNSYLKNGLIIRGSMKISICTCGHYEISYKGWMNNENRRNV